MARKTSTCRSGARSARATPTAALRRDKKELCSIETLKGLQVTVADLTACEKPEDPRDAFVTARQWQQSNYFIGGMHYLNNLFLNYGLKLGPADPAQRTAFDAWLAGAGGLADGARFPRCRICTNTLSADTALER